MRHIPGTIAGLCSGFLLYMMTAMVFGDLKSHGGVPPFAFVMFFGGWVVSHYATVKGTSGFAKPMARAFLIGAGEWLAMVVVGLIFAGKTVAASGAGSEAAKAGAAIGGGIMAFISGAMSIGMAVFCAVGFFVFHFIGREGQKAMAPDEATKRCPDCAELVNHQARKCKHCGHQFAVDQAKQEAV
jgi:hypothetical protein